MKRKDWECSECGAIMLITESMNFMVCNNCIARMRRLWGIKDLPIAQRYDYKRFLIRGADSYNGKLIFMEYVPHAHKDCLSHAPKLNHVVAKVCRGRNDDNGGPTWQTRTFRPSPPPRKKK